MEQEIHGHNKDKIMIRLYLLGITTKHWVDKFDAMGQTGGDDITGSGSQRQKILELIRSLAQIYEDKLILKSFKRIRCYGHGLCVAVLLCAGVSRLTTIAAYRPGVLFPL